MITKKQIMDRYCVASKDENLCCGREGDCGLIFHDDCTVYKLMSALIDELIDSAPSQKINSRNGMDLIGSGHDTHCDIVAKWKNQQKEGG